MLLAAASRIGSASLCARGRQAEHMQCPGELSHYLNILLNK
jgi:hypothetical protein